MSDLSPPQQMIRRFIEFVPARAILVAAKLGIADHINAEGVTGAQLAAKLNANTDALHRLLQLLASIEILHEAADHRFTLTPLGETLRSDTPSSVRDYAVYVHDFIYEGFGGLDEAVRTGKPAFEKIYGMPFFQYLEKTPDRAAVFHAGIGNRGRCWRWCDRPWLCDARESKTRFTR